jgi:hypothetical protein
LKYLVQGAVAVAAVEVMMEVVAALVRVGALTSVFFLKPPI